MILNFHKVNTVLFATRIRSTRQAASTSARLSMARATAPPPVEASDPRALSVARDRTHRCHPSTAWSPSPPPESQGRYRGKIVIEGPQFDPIGHRQGGQLQVVDGIAELGARSTEIAKARVGRDAVEQ